MAETHISLIKDSSFLKECWAWRFEGDDYIAFVSLIMYTADAVLVDLVYHAGTNVDVPPSTINLLTDSEVETIKWGSKCQLAAWYTYTAVIWCMKFMLLFFYRRLTMGTFRGKLINYLFWICGITYVAVFLTITFGCYPTEKNWQVRPLPPKRCTFQPQNFYVGAILNVITDAMILAIPIPMLWKLQVKLSKKIAIGALLSSGLFVITAAIVRAVLTLGATPSGLNINRWGVRETLVGILTVNIPILRPMFRRNFWSSSAYTSHTIEESGSWNTRRGGKSGYGQGTFELRSGAHSRKGDEDDAHDTAASNASQENIISKDSNEFALGGVVVETTYHVQSHRRNEEDGLGNWAKDGKQKGYNTDVTALNA